jgi:hypothetical protein
MQDTALDEPVLDADQKVFLEVSAQVYALLEAATKQTDDDWMPLRMMAKAEKLFAIYADEGFHRFTPLAKQLRATLETAARTARRAFIKRALLCNKEEWPQFERGLERLDDRSKEAREDYDAACKHLDEGRRLMEGLWPAQSKRRLA